MALFGGGSEGGGKKFNSQEYRDKYDQLSKQYRDLYNKRMPILQDYEKISQQQLHQLISRTAPQAAKLFEQANKLTGYADAQMKSALGYDTAARRSQERGQAMADVQQAHDAAREEAASRLESYGIDPSQTRATSLDAGLQLAKTLEQVKAAKDAETGVETRGRAYVSDALAGSTSALGAATGATGVGTNMLTNNVNTANNTAETYGAIFGTPMQNLGARVDIVGQQSALKAAEQASKTSGPGIGGVLGGLGQVAGMGAGAYAGYTASGGNLMGAMYGSQMGGQMGSSLFGTP